MGKILNTLRSNGTHSPRPHPALVPQPTEIEVGGELDSSAMAFIEIGPKRKIIDASADVMAVPVAPTPAAAPVARPHSISFRILPEPKKSRFAQELVAFHDPDQPQAREYARLLKALIEAGRRRPGTFQVMLFTSPCHEAGCTTALLNLAISAARDGLRVAVLDANLRRPGIASRLGVEDAPGLAEVLAGECAVADAIRETEQDDLIALTAGAPIPALVDLGLLRTLVAQLCESVDLVLIDGPRWDGRPGCLTLAELADAVFLVVPSAQADSTPVSELIRDLPTLGVPLAGCVLT